MRDSKGQALVEFILILPIILLLLMCMFDIGNIIYNKYILQNDLDEVSILYQADNQSKISLLSSNNNFNIEYKMLSDCTKITLTKQIEITTPGLSNVLGNPYEIKESKNVYKLVLQKENINE